MRKNDANTVLSLGTRLGLCLRTMDTVTATSAFNCRWTAEGSACEIAGIATALCTRVTPQIITGDDCARCDHWQEAMAAASHWRRVGECPHCGAHQIRTTFSDALLQVLECSRCGRTWTASASPTSSTTPH
jgi:hypothetical protein